MTEVVQPRFVGANDQIGARQLAQLPQFRVGESRLCRAAPAQHDDLLDPASAQRLQGVIGDVRFGEFFRCSTQNAGHVHRDVADTHNSHALAREVEVEVTIVGMSVVPGHEVGSRIAAEEILTGDIHAVVGRSASREDDLVIEPTQVVKAQVCSVFHVAVITKPGIGGNLVVGRRNGLDFLMVRRHTATHQSVWRRQPLQHVNLDDEIFLIQQVFGDIEAARARSNNGHP